MNKLSSFIKANKYMVAAVIVLFIYLSPNIFFPSDARFLIHDNLNSNVVWYKNLAESGKMFAGNQEIIPNSLGGIPRGCYPSELNLMHLLYLFFSPLAAYNINMVLMHFLAFFSMYVFVRRHIFKYKHQWASVLVSLIFSLLPFWPSGGAAIAAQPLLLYALLNIFNYDLNWKNWMIILLIPFYSVLVLSNLFFIITIFIVFVSVAIYKRKINFYFVGALALFAVASVVSEYRLFYMQFIEHFQSHREIATGEGSLNLKGVIGVSLLHFFKGHYHFITVQAPFIIASSIVAVVFAKTKRQRLMLISLLLAAYFISLIFVLPGWDPVAKMLSGNSLMGVLTLRFYSLFPLLWFIIFSFAIKILLESNKVLGKYFVWFAGAAYCIALFISFGTQDYQKSEYAENSFYNTYIDNKSEGHATFHTYYKKDLFTQVKKEVPPGNYLVACLGITPEVVQYNGYHTIDGYFYYYPKSYNTYMKEVCKGELSKMDNAKIKSHCIILSKDLNEGKTIIDSLDIDFDKLKERNVDYLFSTRQVINTRLLSEQVILADKGKLYIYAIN